MSLICDSGVFRGQIFLGRLGSTGHESAGERKGSPGDAPDHPVAVSPGVRAACCSIVEGRAAGQ
ncbi:conserved hypothetical protein [Ricinus communis]|uniref:Uncharacterized protein n=1 Tax=Ricinus communis TaxID=3988 RepID=B9TB96_RICCO|nr:conserved hypothetical protein [Ricinus communis]